MSTVTLNNGLDMPLVGVIIWQTNGSEEHTTVRAALELGYKHISCAESATKHVGDAVALAIDEGIVKRDDVWLSVHYHPAVDSEWEAHIQTALRFMQFEHLDLCILDDNLESDALTLTNKWAVMEGLVERGLVRAVGVSNMHIEKIGGLLPNVKIHLSVCENELHPLFRQDELLAYCSSESIRLLARAPFGTGEIAESYHHTRLLPKFNLLKHETVLGAAIELSKTPAQVLVRFAVQRGTAVLLQTIHRDRLEENIRVFDWKLSAEQFQALNVLMPQISILADD
jgi:diketogulonate reductase-like aldo/keto reductase